jgi:hypothetical protein
VNLELDHVVAPAVAEADAAEQVAQGQFQRGDQVINAFDLAGLKIADECQGGVSCLQG